MKRRPIETLSDSALTAELGRNGRDQCFLQQRSAGIRRELLRRLYVRTNAIKAECGYDVAVRRIFAEHPEPLVRLAGEYGISTPRIRQMENAMMRRMLAALRQEDVTQDTFPAEDPDGPEVVQR